jgi:hypothetical protein
VRSASACGVEGRSAAAAFDVTRGEQLQQRWTTILRTVDGVPDSEDFKPAADCVWTEE